jgi:hypothetical protein
VGKEALKSGQVNIYGLVGRKVRESMEQFTDASEPEGMSFKHGIPALILFFSESLDSWRPVKDSAAMIEMAKIKKTLEQDDVNAKEKPLKYYVGVLANLEGLADEDEDEDEDPFSDLTDKEFEEHIKLHAKDPSAGARDEKRKKERKRLDRASTIRDFDRESCDKECWPGHYTTRDKKFILRMWLKQAAFATKERLCQFTQMTEELKPLMKASEQARDFFKTNVKACYQNEASQLDTLERLLLEESLDGFSVTYGHADVPRLSAACQMSSDGPGILNLSS